MTLKDPNDPVHLNILAEVCDRHLFMHKDGMGTSRLLFSDTLSALMREPLVKAQPDLLACRSCT